MEVMVGMRVEGEIVLVVIVAISGGGLRAHFINIEVIIKNIHELYYQ